MVIARASIIGSVVWVGSLLGAVEYVATNHWIGAGELCGMMLWTIPFAAVVSMATIWFYPIFRRLPLPWALIIAAVVGPAFGFGTFMVGVALQGGWVVPFPVFSCWAFGGLLGLLALVGISKPRAWYAIGGMTLVGIAVLVWGHLEMLRRG